MSYKEYSIQDKMLIRSLAEFIIETPNEFLRIFRNPDDIVLIFPELTDLLEYMYGTVDIEHWMMIQIINQIEHESTKAIFEIVYDKMRSDWRKNNER